MPYPKVITLADGTTRVVANRFEEAIALKRPPLPAPVIEVEVYGDRPSNLHPEPEEGESDWPGSDGDL